MKTTMNIQEINAIAPQTFLPQIQQLVHQRQPHYRRLWDYYRNPLRLRSGSRRAENDRPYRQGQEWGLPARITGAADNGFATDELSSDGPEHLRKEVVIENDIGWRVDTMVDYLFGKAVNIDSTAADKNQAQLLTRVLREIFAANGGIQFFQQLALIGSVYGFVDVLVKFVPAADQPADIASSKTSNEEGTNNISPSECFHENGLSSGSTCHVGPAPMAAPACPVTPSLDEPPADRSAHDCARDALVSSSEMDWLLGIARMIRLEIVEPARALPLLDDADMRQVRLYAQVYDRPGDDELQRQAEITPPVALQRRGLWRRLQRTTAMWLTTMTSSLPRQATQQVVDVLTAQHWGRFVDGQLQSGGNNRLGRIPLVHIQNLAMPFEYSGAGDVEGLIPLQDELNTRLCDRANRITLQCFRMYLGKGIEDFTSQTIAPGRMWKTDNPEAEIITFGGDDAVPSEEAHINDVREAMDKSSGVSPIAAGAIKGRIGRLTSAAALRITLLSLLAKNDRKRTAYGRAIEQMCELALQWLDVMKVLATRPDERGVNINWPSPLPENVLEKLQEARAKVRLGIDRQLVLRELGY